MTELAGVTLEMRVPVTPCRARTSLLPDHVVDAKSALRPEALKPTFTGFRIVARLGSLPRASCATANRASRPRRRLKPPVDLAEALRRAAHQGAPLLRRLLVDHDWQLGVIAMNSLVRAGVMRLLRSPTARASATSRYHGERRARRTHRSRSRSSGTFVNQVLDYLPRTWGLHRHQPSNRGVVTGNCVPLAGCHSVEEPGQMRLGLEGTHRINCGSISSRSSCGRPASVSTSASGP